MTATNAATGCTSQQTVLVTADRTKPELQASASGTITCDVTEVTLTATSITPNVTFIWEGFTAGENPVNVSSEGEYIVTATNAATGCTSQQTVLVTADRTKPELQASASGTITCDVTEVTLTATSMTPDVTFTWEGFTAGENPVSVSSDGEYSVTATNTATGCTSQQTVIVTADNTKPELQATTSGTITCDVTEVTLTATSTTPDVTFSWEGFTAGENPVNVSSGGEYSVTATNTTTGCISQQTVTVKNERNRPDIQTSVNGAITCINRQVILTATSTTPNVTFTWDGFPDGENPIEVNYGGQYVVTATNTLTGCSNQKVVFVETERTRPDLDVFADGAITCINRQVTLTATSTTPNVTFTWDGFPDGENPIEVNYGGQYVVTATNTLNGCTKQKIIEVETERTRPDLQATADGVISCDKTEVTLTASSMTPNVSFTWEGFTAGQNPVEVQFSGQYVVTATNTLNGCTSQQTVIVTADRTKPELQAATSGTITCDVTKVTLTATSMTPDVTFSWEGFTAGENPVNVSSEGEYIVTATNTATGCTSQQTVLVTADRTKPELQATASGTITCDVTEVTLTATSMTPDVTFSWEGFTAGENPVSVSSEGEYIVTATNAVTGCTSQQTVLVTADRTKPELQAAASGTITCDVTEVTLTATSTTPDVTFSWEGFTAGQNPVNVSSEGEYIVTATNTITGCTSQQTVLVTADRTKPELQASASGTITCDVTELTLTATSMTPDVTFSWEGFTAGQNPVNVSSEGEYIVTATNAATGCTSQQTVLVTADRTKPELQAAASGTITCDVTEVTLTATSITPDVTFSWEGFTAGQNPVNVSSEGEYIVTATNAATGCTSQQTVIVTADRTKPELQAAASGTITCDVTEVTLTATSMTPDVTFSWEGFTAGQNPVSVSSEGEYIVTATNTATGCTSQQTVLVTADRTKPELQASASGTITCDVTEVTLTATSTTPDVTLSWEGFTAGENPVNVSSEGEYIVTATNTATGCTSQQTVLVTADRTKPELQATASGTITCDVTEVTLTATSITPDVTFSWEGFTAGENPVNVSSEGEYIVTATNTITGCTSQQTVIVTADRTKPELQAAASGTITCDVTEVTLTATSITPDVTFSWEGFTAGQNPVNVSSEGEYIVTATNAATGCTSQQTVIVTADRTKPELQASASGTITCDVTEVTLTATSMTPNVTLTWEGFTAGQNPVNVSSEGEYIVTATNAATGCTSQQTVLVTADRTKPELQASANGTITCDVTEVTLTATSMTPDVTFSWEGFTAGENPVNVSSEGEYIVTATNAATGCTSQQTVLVTADRTKPELQAAASGTITCDVTEVTLTATSMTPNVTFTWEGFTAGQNPVNVSSEGEYIVTATNSATGCTSQQTVLVTADRTKPELQATASGTITCDVTEVTLTATSMTPDVTFSWEGFTAGENPVSVSSEGEYIVTATNAATGCTSQQTVIVTADRTKPELQATASGTITCDVTEVTLTATSMTPDVTFSWEGFTAGQNPVNVSSEGEYIVTATNTATGCTSQQTVLVTADRTKPELQAAASGTITCDVTEVTLTATSTTPDVTFSWEGFTAGQNPVSVSSEGEYIVTATNTATGCTSQQTVLVTADRTKPELQAAASGTITCDVTEVTLTATSMTPDVTFSWEGFTAGENPVSVSSEGEYIVTATNTATGCTSQQTVLVTADRTKPELQATASGTITCDVTKVTLTATSTTPDVTFTWEGFIAGENPVNVSSEGEYIVTATNTATGCTSQQTVLVTADRTKPELQASASGTITCDVTEVTLTATSMTPDVTFTWEGFIAGENPVNVSSEGEYIVTATNTATGCTSQQTVLVTADRTKPELQAAASGTITCDVTEVTLTATSTTPDVTFSWEGFTAGENPVSVSSEGEYIVTATNTATGCTSQQTVLVTADRTKPELQASASGTITCDVTEVTLTATSMTPDVTFSWEGFTAGQNPVNVSSEGEYIVTATNAATGCTSQQTVLVTADRTKPELQAAASGTITCDVTEVTLTATSMTPDVSFSWIGFTAGENPVNVSSEGQYIVTATNTITGCTSRETVLVVSTCEQRNGEPQSLSNSSIKSSTRLNSKAYPNPSKDRVTIDFNSIQSGKATVKVYSMTGILTHTISDIKVEANKKYQVTFNEDGLLPAGVYLYVIQLGKHSIRNRIILTK
ncbi:hypothetical protein AWE51_25565 [Aquimarina aggregata]|uniref:Ig-like domain-containing protein n=1 Tax=Aquimarina aggregata TaxID=1642818 RepID=A0A162ZVY8_9FLAO|nr:hypothetical protein AWE51_25565 [Aquimarina aggregata]